MTTTIPLEPGDAEVLDWELLGVDPSSVAGEWADEAMSAAFRMSNRAAWSLACWIWEAAHASAGSTARVTQRRRPGKVPAASLGWSEGFGASRIEFARQILQRLPRLGAAMESGGLEEYKARIFTSTLADLDDAQAREVVDRLVDRAPGWTYQQLREAVERAAKAVDPAWAEARKAAAIARRRVVFGIEPSGAAALRGLDLPLDPAQDSHDRIVALAAVARDRLRTRGRDVPKGQVESEVLLVLTGPAGAGLWDEDVVDLVLSRFERGPDDDGCGSDGSGSGGPNDDGPRDDEPDGGHEGGGAHDGPAGGEVDDPRRGAVPFLARPAIRLGLRTVLGFDRRPGVIPGAGSACSSTARTLAWDRTDAVWRLVLYGAEDQLEYVLTLRPPRAGPPGAGGRRRRHVVELTAYTTEVDELATILDPDTEVAEGVGFVPGHVFELIRRAVGALAAARARPADEHPAVSTIDAHRRMPGAALRLWVLYRDLTCRGVGCSKPATIADVDHTHDHVLGGDSVAGNLGPFCEGDHLFKHDPTTGWTVEQTAPGRFEWTAPTGRRHTLTPEPYDPLPDPVSPSDSRRFSVPGEAFLPIPRPRRPFAPRPNRHGNITDAARDAADHLARRAAERDGRTDPAEEEPPF
jgi:hypothetical protein